MFDRGTRGWFLRKVVLRHGGGGGTLLTTYTTDLLKRGRGVLRWTLQYQRKKTVFPLFVRGRPVLQILRAPMM